MIVDHKRLYRFPVARAACFNFCLLEPRGTVRFALGAAFFRAVRFTFFRSAVSVIALVFAICLGDSLSFCETWIVESKIGETRAGKTI